MGPYRTAAEPTRRPPPPRPKRDREDVIVHGAIAITGLIGAISATVIRDFGGGFALASLLVVVGVVGAVRRPEV